MCVCVCVCVCVFVEESFFVPASAAHILMQTEFKFIPMFL